MDAGIVVEVCVKDEIYELRFTQETFTEAALEKCEVLVLIETKGPHQNELHVDLCEGIIVYEMGRYRRFLT